MADTTYKPPLNCVFCKVNAPHERHVTVDEARRLDVSPYKYSQVPEVLRPVPPEVSGDVGIDDAPWSFESHMRRVERTLIYRALAETDGNQVQASKLLGLPRSTFTYKVKELGFVA